MEHRPIVSFKQTQRLGDLEQRNSERHRLPEENPLQPHRDATCKEMVQPTLAEKKQTNCFFSEKFQTG